MAIETIAAWFCGAAFGMGAGVLVLSWFVAGSQADRRRRSAPPTNRRRLEPPIEIEVSRPLTEDLRRRLDQLGGDLVEPEEEDDNDDRPSDYGRVVF